MFMEKNVQLSLDLNKNMNLSVKDIKKKIIFNFRGTR